MRTSQFLRLTRFGLVLIAVAVLSVASVPPASAQFGAIRDAARRAADEAKKAEEAKKKAEEAKKTTEDLAGKQPSAGEQPAATPAPAAAPASAAATPSTAPAAAAAPTFQTYSKFDFVPGEKIIAVDDFTQDAVGDFPDKWNTNASGEIVTVAGQT